MPDSPERALQADSCFTDDCGKCRECVQRRAVADYPPLRDGWAMPGWMEPHRDLIQNTGGNPLEELVNDSTTTVGTNAIRAVLCVAAESQVRLLYGLRQRGAIR